MATGTLKFKQKFAEKSAQKFAMSLQKTRCAKTIITTNTAMDNSLRRLPRNHGFEGVVNHFDTKLHKH